MKQPSRTIRILLTVVVIVLLIGGGIAAANISGNQNRPPVNYSLVHPITGPLVATVNATGQLEPTRVVNLSLAGVGQVTEVRVQVGDTVQQGAVLAKLDTRDLELRVAQAEAALEQAQASYDRLVAGPTPAEIKAAEAQLAAALGQLQQIEGNVTPADLRAAEAQLRQARATLARLQGNPRAAELGQAQAQLREAELNLEAQRSQFSASKTNAQLQMEQAVARLTQAQSSYSTAKQNWDYVRETGNDPIAREVDPTNPTRTRPRKLTDAERQRYYDLFVQAEAGLRSAEQSVEQARVTFDNARQAEASGVELAEGRVLVAQETLNRLYTAADIEQLAAAQAAVAQAQSALARLNGEARSGALQSANSSVEQARANLERLTAKPREFEVTSIQAQIRNARVALELARLALSQATLTAPFAGIIAEVNLKVGEAPAPGRAAVVLADLSAYYVNVTIDEIDIARVTPGQAVTLTLDALQGTALQGRVETVAPLATIQSAVTNYRVRVVLTSQDARVRPGMSATADIVVAAEPQALQVPRRAIRSDRGQFLVDLASTPGACEAPEAERPQTPALTERVVSVGLGNEQVIQITSGLTEADCVYVSGIEQRRLFFGPPPRSR